jgi:flagellum-specific peptidoglycan hydrolase FlgJ
MPQTQQNFSEWAKTYSSRTYPTPLSIWERNDGFLWKAAVLIGLTYIVWADKFSFTLLIDTTESTSLQEGISTLSLLGSPEQPERNKHPARKKTAAKLVNEIIPSTSGSTSSSRDERCKTYIHRFSTIAVAEMKKFGIPASIILAQGLVESNSGLSSLASKANNHFGIKCFSKNCSKGHCMNFSDDSHKDFFVRYSNAWSSFRAHSQFLKKTSRYSHLFKSRNATVWAKGLEKAGYATDKQYAEKLLAVIDRFNLEQFDR